MTTAEIMFAQPGDAAIDRKQEARKVLWALLAALFVHLLVAFTVAGLGGVFSPALPVEEKPVELTIIDLSAPPPVVPKNPAFMETDESKQSAEAPKEKTFESNANSIAASQQSATGGAPLPSQQGIDRPGVDLETHQYSLLNEGAQSQPSAAPQESPKPSDASGKAGHGLRAICDVNLDADSDSPAFRCSDAGTATLRLSRAKTSNSIVGIDHESWCIRGERDWHAAGSISKNSLRRCRLALVLLCLQAARSGQHRHLASGLFG